MEPLCKQLLETHKTHVFTKNMTSEQWLLARRNGIGGSDAGAVMGLNKWASPLTVYLDKKGLSHFDGNRATERGSWLEAPIREKAKKALGVLIEECPYMFTSDINPFMSANIDGLIYILYTRYFQKKIVESTISVVYWKHGLFTKIADWYTEF